MSKGITLLCLSLVLTFCVVSADVIVSCTETSSYQCIKVGFTYANTGSLNPEGQQMKNGYVLWAQQVNSKGGIVTGSGTYQFSLIAYDDQSNRTLVNLFYTQLILNDQVDYLLGPYGSSLSITAGQVAALNSKNIILSSASSASVYGLNLTNIFGVTVTSTYYTTPFLQKVESLGAKTVGVISSTDIFSSAVALATTTYLKSDTNGLTFTTQLRYSAANATAAAMQEVIGLMAANNPDVFVFCGLYAESVPAIHAVYEIGFKPKAMFFTTAPSQPQFIEDEGAHANYLVGAAQWTPDVHYSDSIFGSATDYSNLFQKTFNEEATTINAQGSAAGVVLQLAIQAQDGKPTESQLNSILEQMDANTFFGRIKFGADGENIGKEILSVQVLSGSIEIVLPTNISTKPFAYPVQYSSPNGAVSSMSWNILLVFVSMAFMLMF